MEGKNWGCFSSPLNPTFIIPLPCITPVLRCRSPLSSSMDPSICNINWETLPSRPSPKAQTSGWTSWRGGAIGKLRLEECAKMGVEVLFERLHASSSKFHQ